MGLINCTVSLEKNYELWKKIFINEKKYLESIFTEDNFKIEHVVSTSVKELSSKPIVDIAVGVNNLNSLNKYIAFLKKSILSNLI